MSRHPNQHPVLRDLGLHFTSRLVNNQSPDAAGTASSRTCRFWRLHNVVITRGHADRS